MCKTTFTLKTCLGETKETSVKSNNCNREPTPFAKIKENNEQYKLGQCVYYKMRYLDFMERHKNCSHIPPVYYYGEMLKINSKTEKFYNQKAISPELAKYAKLNPHTVQKQDRGGIEVKPFIAGSYGFKYCIRFSHVLMNKLSPSGQLWLTFARFKLQELMEKGVVEKSYIAKYDEIFKNCKIQIIRKAAEKVNAFIKGKAYSFNKNFIPTKDELNKVKGKKILAVKIKVKEFYTNIELHNERFQEFAFATHPDAYDPKLMSQLPPADLALISLSPDFKEWLGDGWQSTFLQAILVLGNMDYIDAIKATVKRYYYPYSPQFPINFEAVISDITNLYKETVEKATNEISYLATEWKYDKDFVVKNSLKNER
jgi:hypothetical protein